MSPRIGRPTDNPKIHRMAIRLDEASKQIIDAYSNQENINLNEAVRHGIKMLEAKIKK